MLLQEPHLIPPLDQLPALEAVPYHLRQPPVPFFIRPISSKIADQVDAAFTIPQIETHFSYVDEYLGEHPWFAGDDISAADIQMSFPLEAALAANTETQIKAAAGQTAVTSVEAGGNAGESTFLLLVNLVHLAGFLSVGLGLVNLLPIPILDGGHLVYYAYEAVARRPLSMKAQAIGFRVGLALVLGMMLVATWNDLNYLLGQIF